MKLTPKQNLVLAAVAKLYERRAVYPNHHQIAMECGKEYSRADWAHDALRQLSRSRMIVPVGKSSPYGGRRWKITKNGLKAMSASQ